MVVANRFGHGSRGSKPIFFNEETFSIPSPFDYDFGGSLTAIVSRRQEVLASISDQKIQVAYADLPIVKSRSFPVVRRPALYPLLAQDTLEPYTLKQFGLPSPTVFGAAAIDPGPQSDPWSAAAEAAQRALDVARERSLTIRLMVFPANYFGSSEPNGLAKLQAFAKDNGTDLVLGMAGAVPRSVMVTSGGEVYEYSRTHRLRSETIPDSKLGPHYWVVDRDYGRVALLHDVDLMVPETSLV